MATIPNLPSCSLELDQLVAQFVEELWQDGEPKSAASYTVAAVQHFMPEMKNNLRCAWRLVRAWGKLEMPERATPFEPFMLWAFSSYFLQKQHLELALLLPVAFAALLRTGEFFLLRKGDVVFGPDSSEAILSLKDTKGVQRRAGPQEERIVLRDRLAIHCLHQLCDHKLPGDKVLGMSSTKFRDLWLQAVKHFGLENFHYPPYAIRRGGATWYFRQTNSMDAVMVLGRWAQARTARIYIEDAMATLRRLALPKATLEQLHKQAAGQVQRLYKVGLQPGGRS
jgi:hypothetical protein